MKLTKRKGFNFFRSYYDVYNELSDKDKVQFMDALLDRQFLGVKPDNLTGMAKFAYISQTNSIDTQVKGYEDKTNTKLGVTSPPTVGGRQGGNNTPTEQEKEKEKEKEKEEVKDKEKVKLKKFESFWLKYPSKVNKKDCLKKWLTLSDDEIEKIESTIDDFIKYKPFKEYNHPNPKTYLNGERWNDEIKVVKPVDDGRYKTTRYDVI